jgi:hypothetical protein
VVLATFFVVFTNLLLEDVCLKVERAGYFLSLVVLAEKISITFF